MPVIYELRFRTGEKAGQVCPLGSDPSLTDDQELALMSGAAQLVRIDARGESSVVDVDDITEVSPEPLRSPASAVAAAIAPIPPLLSVRVLASDSSAFYEGRAFDTLSAFDSAVQAELAPQAHGHVVFVITWYDDSAFEGCFDIGAYPDECLIDNIIRVCGDMVASQHNEVAAAATLLRTFQAATAESYTSSAVVALQEEILLATKAIVQSANGTRLEAQWIELHPRRTPGRNVRVANLRYTTEGALRGRCGHHHKKLESAVDCLTADEERCVLLGGHTDREIFAVGPGVKRELNDEERTAVALHRLLSPGHGRS